MPNYDQTTLPASDFPTWQPSPSAPERRFARLPATEAFCGLKKSAIYYLIARNMFPKPYKLAGRAVGWLVSDLEAWAASRQQAA